MQAISGWDGAGLEESHRSQANFETLDAKYWQSEAIKIASAIGLVVSLTNTTMTGIYQEVICVTCRDTAHVPVREGSRCRSRSDRGERGFSPVLMTAENIAD